MPCLSMARLAASRTRRSAQGDFGFHCSGELHPPARGRDGVDQSKLGVGLDGRRLHADHQVAEVRLAGFQHGQAGRAVGDALDDDALDRRLLAPVLLVRLQHDLHARVHTHEPKGSQPHGLTAKAVLADLLDVFLGHDPGGAGGRGGVEDQKVRPGAVQDEPHAMGVDDLHGLHPLVQNLGRDAPVALEAELHVLGRERIAVVEPETLAQLEFVHEPVRTLSPRLGQARRHVVAGQRLDQRVVQGVEEHKRRAESRRLGRIEKRGSDGGVEGDGQLALGPALTDSFSSPRHQEENEYGEHHAPFCDHGFLRGSLGSGRGNLIPRRSRAPRRSVSQAGSGSVVTPLSRTGRRSPVTDSKRTPRPAGDSTA